VLIYLGLKNRQSTIAEIAMAFGVSKNHLTKVVHQLSSKGFLRSTQGPAGGIQLARAPAEIRLGDFVQATEPHSRLVECFDPARNTCPIAGVCRLEGLLHEARQNFFGTLNRHSLADLLVDSPERAERMRRLGIVGRR
jgi:Rrf2 family nitric oxide-sensitive transcriptional repressor